MDYEGLPLIVTDGFDFYEKAGLATRRLTLGVSEQPVRACSVENRAPDLPIVLIGRRTAP